MIIGLLGRINSGKGTVSDYLETKYNFRPVAFADSLRYVLSHTFGWPVELLQGRTPESRAWREQVDYWWANRLGIPNLTPRMMLQQWGTDLVRNHFHEDLWLASLERQFINYDGPVVIGDCRQPNEIQLVRKLGGKLVLVTRGGEPEWMETARDVVQKYQNEKMPANNKMSQLYPNVHVTEWLWINEVSDYVIRNNAGLPELHEQTDEMIQDLFPNQVK